MAGERRAEVEAALDEALARFTPAERRRLVGLLARLNEELQASQTGIAWLLTGYLLSASVGTAILGRLGDMFGKEQARLDARRPRRGHPARRGVPRSAS